MGRNALRGLVACWLLVAACAFGTDPTGTAFPAAIDTSLVEVYSRDPTTGVCSGPGGNGCTVLAAPYNVVQSGLRAVETALGADATWASRSVLARLAGKVDADTATDFTAAMSFAQIDNTLVANAYAGADIGEQINAAITDCTTQFGQNTCRIILRPNDGQYASMGYELTQATSGVHLNRSNTILDCQGATLIATSTFQDAVLRINVDNLNLYNEPARHDITVQNCTIKDTAQTSRWATDHRSAVVTAYNIDRLKLDRVRVISSIGSAIYTMHVRASVMNDLSVFGTRTNSYIGLGAATGITLWGDGYGLGTGGDTVSAAGLHVEGSANKGIQLVVGVEASRVTVKDAQGACVALGGDADAQGWITLNNFELTDCTLGAAVAIGAIDDQPAATLGVLNDVHIATGRIRGANADGIRFANTHTLTNISINNVAIECPAQTVAESAGIAFAGLGSGAGAMSMVQIASNAVHYDPACAGPAAGASGILIHGTDTSHFSILDNQLLGRASSSYSGVGIGLTMDAGVSLVAPPILLQALVAGNTIQQFGNAGVQLTAANSGQVLADILSNNFIHNCRVTSGAGSHCGAISAVATTTDAMVGGVHISSNTSTEHPYSVETWPASDGILGPFVIDANELSDTDDYYWSTSPADSGGLFEGLVETHRAGANLFSNRSPSSIKLTNGTGTNVDSGTLVCLTTTANSTFVVCTAATKARLAGVLNERTANTTLGAILTRGIVHFVGCTGTVARGDLLETNDSGQAITAATPAVGAVLGKALSTCSGGHLTALVTVS